MLTRVGGDVDDDGRGQDGGDQVIGVEEVPERAEQAPHRQAQADQVHHGEGDPGRHRQAAQVGAERGILREVEEVGAIGVEDSLERHHDVAAKIVQICQLQRLHRGDLVPVQVADQPHGERGRHERQHARRHQGQLEPLGGQRLARRQARAGRPGTYGQQDTGGADHGERDDRVQHGHPVGDHHPGERHPGRDRDVPAPRRAVQHQEDEQQRELGAQVIRLRQQQVGGVPELGREHDPARHRQPDQPFPPGRTPPGQQPGRQHQQRVGDRAGYVDDIAAQAPEQLHERVLGNFRRVVRHVAHGPAVQQHVPVQHVPALQRLVRAVRGSGVGPGQPQVGNEQNDGHHDRPGNPQPAGTPPAPGSFPRHLLNRSASSHVLDGTLTRRTGRSANHAQTLADTRATSFRAPS